MPLILHELIHFTLSLLAAYFFSFIYKDTSVSFMSLAITALAGGFFIDVDHLIDYIIAYGLDFNIKHFFAGKEFEKNKKIYVLFHGYEYVIILTVVAFFLSSPTLQASIYTLALSSLFHLLVDVQVNTVFFRTYSILYRIRHNFNIKKLSY